MTCATCPTCELGLHHCHGLVAIHDDGGFTCLDGCGAPLAVHDDAVDCAVLGLGCCAEQPVPLITSTPPAAPAWAA